ncbi:MAG TPA: DUF4232 domain-containing protein [Candidatus Dormibacteraeota bacterium]|nr:DUF4232 domain-containing protein [Candidatus Dormibacteraeota bacterium]
MSLSRLLACTVAMAVLAACTTGATPPVAGGPRATPTVQTSPEPTTTPVISPTPPAVPSPHPLVIPRPTMPFVRCDTKDLEMRLVSLGAAAGNIAATIEVRNKSQHGCDLYGYAGLQLLDAHGRALPTHAIRSTTSFFLSEPAVAQIVGLPAGTVPIRKIPFDPMHPVPEVPGHAYVPLSWEDVLTPCSTAVQLKVTPPDAYTSLTISAADLFSPAMNVCPDGTIWVNPTRAAVRA